MMKHRKVLALSVALLAGASTLAVPAEAQTDGRWTPFLGCWQPAAGSPDGGLLCFRPLDADNGVEMLTVADGEIVLSEIFRADGTPQSIEREGCTGTESAEFSSDSRRVYTRALYTCSGDVTQSATGIMSMASPTQWMDVRAVGIEGEQMAWVQFYEFANPATVEEAGLADITENLGMAIRGSRMAASAPVDFDDILEAAEHVDAKAVQAWIAERGESFDLSASDLIALDDAGLDAEIIDVMVAVSNPGYFTIDGRGEAEATPTGVRGTVPMRSAWNRYPLGRYYDPFFFDPFYYGYSSRYGYGYSPWGRGLFGGYGGWYGGYVPTPIVVTPVESQPSGGRVVNGQGYRRGSSGSTSRSQPAYRGGGGSGSSSRGAAASSGGYTRGGSTSSSSGSSTGRTARRRGGGGI